MIGLDSNVLIRYITRDDAKQAARATKLIERQLSDTAPGYVSLIVLVELWWVLKRLYDISPPDLRSLIQDIVDTRQFIVQDRDVVTRVLRRADVDGVDFADGLIVEIAAAAGCDRVVSFDKGAVKAGMKLLV